MPFDATPPAIRRIMHKPKDNSRYGDEIRAEERKEERAGRGGRGVVGAKNSYLKMYLPSGSQESPSAWKVRFLPFCFCFRVYARMRTYARVCVRVRLPLYPRRCRNRGGTQIRWGRGGGEHLPILIYTCAWTRVRVRVRVDVCQRLLRPSVAFPCLNARRLNAKAFQIDVEARRFETETMDKGKTDNPRCNSW